MRQRQLQYSKRCSPRGIYMREKYLCKKIGWKRGEGILLEGGLFLRTYGNLFVGFFPSNSLLYIHYHHYLFHTSTVALLSYTFTQRVINLYTIYFWDSQACQRWLCTQVFSMWYFIEILLSLLIFILNHELVSVHLLTVSIFELKMYGFALQNLQE